MIRIDKFLSNIGRGTRQEIAHLCKKGLIKSNNQIIKNSSTKIKWGDIVSMQEGEEIREVEAKEFVHILMFKPKGYVCSDVEDGGHPSYNELLQDCPYWLTLHVAGRLDQDTTGLVIATNDGDFNHRIISPKHKMIKSYLVSCEKEVTPEMKAKLESGVTLDDGYETLPAVVKIPQFGRDGKTDIQKKNIKNYIELQISEGKYHQVKRMLEAVENRVTHLHRQSIGERTLEGLSEGEWKYI